MQWAYNFDDGEAGELVEHPELWMFNASYAHGGNGGLCMRAGTDPLTPRSESDPRPLDFGESATLIYEREAPEDPGFASVDIMAGSSPAVPSSSAGASTLVAIFQHLSGSGFGSRMASISLGRKVDSPVTSGPLVFTMLDWLTSATHVSDPIIPSEWYTVEASAVDEVCTVRILDWSGVPFWTFPPINAPGVALAALQAHAGVCNGFSTYVDNMVFGGGEPTISIAFRIQRRRFTKIR